MQSMFITVVSYAMIIATIFVVVEHHPEKILATFRNHSDRNMAVCFKSPYVSESELVAVAPDDCSFIGRRSSINVNTYEGHAFVILPWEKPDNVPTEYGVVVMRPDVTVVNVELDAVLSAVPPLWYTLKANRHYLSLLVGVLALFVEYISTTMQTSDDEKRYNHRQEVESSTISSSSTSTTTTSTTTTTSSHRQSILRSQLGELLVPRHSLKGMAVTLMLIDHAAYRLLSGSEGIMRVFTLPADIGSSMHIFSWLTGYHVVLDGKNSSFTAHNSTNTSFRSASVAILIVYYAMDYWVRLPSPFTYEALMTVVLARSLFSTRYFAVRQQQPAVVSTEQGCAGADDGTSAGDTGISMDANRGKKTKKGTKAAKISGDINIEDKKEKNNYTSSARITCDFAEFHPWVHSVFLCTLIVTNYVTTVDGLRLFFNSGLIFAVAGRLFVVSASSSLARSNMLLWLFSGQIYVFRGVWDRTISKADFTSSIEVVGICIGVLWQLCVLYVLSHPVSATNDDDDDDATAEDTDLAVKVNEKKKKKTVLFSRASTLAVLLSRYSLEIYVVHLAALYAYMQQMM